MSYKDVPNNQSDALRAGYFAQAHGLTPTTLQVAHRIKLGINDEFTGKVKRVHYQTARYHGKDETVFERVAESFEDLVNFIRNLPNDKVIVGLV